jgi:hypothetical protein
MKRRTRWSVVIPVMLVGLAIALGSILIRPSVEPAAAPKMVPAPVVAARAPSGSLRVVPFGAEPELSLDPKGRRTVPESWQRHDFNGAEYYVIPLARNG